MTKFFLDQHGCAKNQVDGELIISELEKNGWSRTDDAETASLIIINSCGFIESAKKVHDFLTVGAASPLQEAATVGLNFPESYYEELLETCEEYRKMVELQKLEEEGEN